MDMTASNDNNNKSSVVPQNTANNSPPNAPGLRARRGVSVNLPSVTSRTQMLA